jgi:DNA helicase-2/ATP-dependent DNA helicase PcrA
MNQLTLSWAQSRAVFGQRRLSEPSRFLTEIPRERVVMSGEGRVSRTPAPPPRNRRPAWATPAAVDAPPTTASDLASLRPGARVRHPLFGVGTVLRSDGAGDELKLTVSFAGVGAKRLVARYAGLEPL